MCLLVPLGIFGAGLFVSACVVAAVTFATKEAPLDKHNFLRGALTRSDLLKSSLNRLF